MPAEVNIPLGLGFGFLLVVARVGAVFVFVPLPGVKAAPEAARAALVLAIAVALFPLWPLVDPSALTAGRLVGWALAEAAVGIAMGLGVAVVLETFTLAAQIAGLQAGYAYASTIDPNSEADSGVLQVVAQLAGGMLFFAAGLDREVLRLLGLSFAASPPGEYHFSAASAETMIRLTGRMFTMGLRMALPVVGLLILVDVALALAGKLNASLQLLSLAFPAKMLVALAMLAWGAAWLPRLLGGMAEASRAATRHLLGI